MATSKEVEEYALYLKRKIIVCVSVALIRLAYKERKSPQEYTSEFQVLYLQNDDTINPLLKQKLLSYFQDDLIAKLYKTVPLKSSSSNLVLTSSEEIKETGDLFNLHPNSTKDTSKKLKHLEEEIKYFTDRNIQFMKAIIRLKTEVDRKATVSAPMLESTRRDRTDNNDSGVFLSESSVPSNMLKFILHTSDVDRILLQSAKYVMKVVEYEIKYRAVKNFQFWKGSLVEQAVAIVSVLCDEDEALLGMVYKFMCCTLQDIWGNEEIGNHDLIESQIHILGELLNSLELCVQLIKHITDKLEHTLTLPREDNRSQFALKLSHVLHICYKLVNSYKRLKLKDRQKHEEVKQKQDVTTLWKRQYLNVTNQCRSDGDQEVMGRLICVLQRLLISYCSDCPLLAKPIVKCLTCVQVISDDTTVLQ